MFYGIHIADSFMMYIAHDRVFFFFSSRRRHTRLQGDWSSDVCSSDLINRLGSEGLEFVTRPNPGRLQTDVEHVRARRDEESAIVGVAERYVGGTHSRDRKSVV